MTPPDRTAQPIQEFLLTLIENSRRESGVCPCPSFVGDSESWLQVLRAIDRWKMTPALCICLARTEWQNEIPESIQLLLEERSARSKFIQAVLRQECESLLQTLRRCGIDVLLLGRVAFRFQGEIEAPLFDSTVIDLASRDTYAFLAILGKKGYRGTRHRSAHFLELQHGTSMNRVRIHLIDEEEIWDRSNRITQMPSPVDSVAWMHAQLQTDPEWSKSPEAYVMLPGSKSEPTAEIMENWFSTPEPWLSRVLKRL